MASKVCPRCDAQYAKLKSTTCPQCFAKLIEIDDATAEELASERVAAEHAPEFLEAKALDDEQFKEQSFGACLGVVAILLITLVVSIGFIVTAAHKHQHRALTSMQSTTSATLTDPMTPLPIADAPLESVMPPTLGAFHRTELDQDVTLPGTLTHIYHATYVSDSDKMVLDVSAIRSGSPTTEQNTFRLGITLAAQMGTGQKRFVLIFATEHWRYAVIGPVPSRIEQFRTDAANQFHG